MDSKRKAALTDAKQITSSLQRVRENMAAGVMQADEAVNVLLQDGAIIQDSLHDHKYVLKSSLQTTKQRLDRIKSAERREKWSIFLSLSFFTSVVVYIIAKRTRLLTIGWLTMQGVIKGKDLLTSIATVRHFYDNDSSIHNTIGNNFPGVDVIDQEEIHFFSRETVSSEDFLAKEPLIEPEEFNEAKDSNNPVPTTTSISDQVIEPTTNDIIQVSSIDIKVSNTLDDDVYEFDEDENAAAAKHVTMTVEMNNDGSAMNMPEEMNSKTTQLHPGMEKELVEMIEESVAGEEEKTGTITTAIAMESSVVVTEEVAVEGQNAMSPDDNLITISSSSLESVVDEQVGEDNVEANVDKQTNEDVMVDGNGAVKESISSSSLSSSQQEDHLHSDQDTEEHAEHPHQLIDESIAEHQLFSDEGTDEHAEHLSHEADEVSVLGKDEMRQQETGQQLEDHHQDPQQQQDKQPANVEILEQQQQQQQQQQQLREEVAEEMFEVKERFDDAVFEDTSEQQSLQQQEVQADPTISGDSIDDGVSWGILESPEKLTVSVSRKPEEAVFERQEEVSKDHQSNSITVEIQDNLSTDDVVPEVNEERMDKEDHSL